ncbi:MULTISPECIES: hypothetical protein [Ectopseudomonas]|uniref:Uncharacterized protein n=2 Tax=Ectopseudomonas TaxID=3236654 RepID=A0A1G6PRV4_9GAMM|nr:MULTISPECIES: hypothetical protein [Pseudomonas]MBP3061874.1 hypothetical protein [Pseudomonas chengduensis]NNB75166.1 hypothetical protein [Pseudomonas chengduensis]SDC82236.1 hypothetical protein SAMN05216576_10737 [Pseudomonas chengduensis]
MNEQDLLSDQSNESTAILASHSEGTHQESVVAEGVAASPGDTEQHEMVLFAGDRIGDRDDEIAPSGDENQVVAQESPTSADTEEPVTEDPFAEESFLELDAQEIAAINGESTASDELIVGNEASINDNDLPGENSDEFLGAESAREFLLQQGAGKFSSLLSNAAGQEYQEEQFGGEHHPEGMSMRSFARGAAPAGSMLPPGDAGQAQAPQYSATAQVVGALASGLVGAVRGMVGAVAGRPAATMVKGCQTFMNNRSERTFQQNMSAVEAVASEWKAASTDHLGDEEKLAAFMHSETALALTERMAKAAASLEQSARQMALTALKNGMDSDEVLEKTAAKIARFTDQNKEALALMKQGDSSMLERFDRITNDLFTMIKNAVLQMVEWVTGQKMEQEPGVAATAAPRMG